MQPQDILILTNGPGEVTTWVLPVVREIRKKLGYERSQLRISVILSPCPNATGREGKIAQSYREVDRVQEANQFFPFLLWGKTADNWDWRKKGIVLFLGGDQIFPVVIGKRLGYRTVVYAEWDARWYQWIDKFGVMKGEVVSQTPQKYKHKFTVVGDLMADVGSQIKEGEDKNSQNTTELIGFLPGSKGAKLTQGVPLMLTIAQYIHYKRPQTRFIVPVAPTLDVPTLAKFADPQNNPLINKFGGVSAKLIETDTKHFLQTSQGIQIELVTQFPAYELLSRCSLCITTVGANTAQLGSLAVPMIVLLPTQQLDAMRAWDGIPGILANLPGIGSSLAKLINWLVLQQGRLFAWPNIWAKEEIVPELVGELKGEDIGERVLDFLTHSEKLEKMRSRLRQVRGNPGAAEKLAQIVAEESERNNNSKFKIQNSK